LAFTELPAGMLDDGGTFAGAAAREIEEECDLSISESELVNLSELALASSSSSYSTSTFTSSSSHHHQNSTDDDQLPAGVYPSVGACDEFISIFLCQKRVARQDLKGWEGKLTGLRDEGETITLKLVKLNDLWKVCCRDAKSLSALALYTGLKAEGVI
jgi:ADP-sugar diphosphatase